MDDYARIAKDERVPKSLRRSHEPVLERLGTTIRAMRLERGISQEHLALIADIDRSYVGRLERGENNVAVLTLVKIAGAMEVSVAELMRASDL